MDIAGLSKLSADTIALIVGILGFLVCLLPRIQARSSERNSLGIRIRCNSKPHVSHELC